MRAWRSPVTGARLRPDTAWSLAGDGLRWPVVDDIPYLRIGREPLIAAVLALLDAGDTAAATALLLADQDDWWTGPTANPDDLARLVAGRDSLSLRAAMALLQLGPVADYFAYRWIDPTYLAGLALIEAHWAAPASAFELACGIGHYLRDLADHGVACLGADVVFAKCWLARHWIAPAADYVVFDAGGRWPLLDRRFDLVLCNDAFYFLPEQPAVAATLRGLRSTDGMLAISHVHNADHVGGARGPARSAAAWRSLFPDATVYDERALLRALRDASTPAPCGWTDDAAVEAWSLVEGPAPARALTGGLTLPARNSVLSVNPLIDGDAIRWPSARWQAEYGGHAPWIDASWSDPVRGRRLVALPERW